MLSLKSWKVVPFAACLSIVGACGTAPEDTSTEEVSTPPAGSAGNSGPATSGSAGKPAAGAAGTKAASAGSSSAGTTAGAGGAAAASSAVAMIKPFTASAPTTGAAGAAGTGSANAGAGGAAGKAGASGSTSAAGAGGNGAGAGMAALSGTATFTKAAGTQVDVNIEVNGCEDGKSYPVHIHEGTSCESTQTQGAHWGEPQALMVAAAGAGGSAAGGSGAAGSGSASAGSGGTGHAGASGEAGAGGAGGAGAPATFKYRGEGIPDIKCSGTTGTTVAKRNTSDNLLTWSIGTGDETDVVGHVVVVHDGAARIACGKIELK